MKALDAIVVGLGAMGAATTAALASRGARALALEAEPRVPHDRGSSHGRSRVIRKAYFEDPSYVPLLERAYTLWTELGAATDEPVLVRTGCLNFGAPDHELVRGVLESVTMHGLAHERLDADAMRRRFPALRPADHEVGLYEEEGGLLVPETCVRLLHERAVAGGASVRLGERVLGIEARRDGVAVRTDAGSYAAAKLVVCAGAWLAGPNAPVRYDAPLAVTRQVQLWFDPRERSELYDVGRLPCFIHVEGARAFYGLPRHAGAGVKVCRHGGGEASEPDTLRREVHDADEREVRAWSRERLPGADVPRTDAVVCMYTTTPDGHFVVGAHPTVPNVLVGGGFSGHGFKLAPTIGEALADLATDGTTAHDIALFDPSRFAALE